MTELVFHTYRDIDLGNSVLIVGFPSLGLVSSIATNFLIKELKMDLIASITSPAFPPYAIVQDGIPMPQLRIYFGRRIRCSDDKGIDSDNLVIITSEFMPKPEMHSEIVDMLMDWIKTNEIGTVITLEGIPQFDPEVYNIIGVGSTDRAREMLKQYGIESFDDGMVRGLSGLMLSKGADEDTDVITVLGSARSDMPDPRGAAKIMEPLSRMLPELKIDTEPLYKEAEELDTRLREQQFNNLNDRVLYG